LSELAQEKDLVLAVGVFRRYYPVTSFMKQVLDTEWLGSLKSVDVEEGGGYDWDLQSKAMMIKSLAGGGVLVDTGAHTIDRTLWLLGGDVELDSYEDNSQGGLETDCVLKAHVTREQGSVQLRIALSRTRVLTNRFRFSFEHGTLAVPANDPSKAWIHDRRLDSGTKEGRFRVETRPKYMDPSLGPTPYFEEQVSDFACAIEGKDKPLNDAATTLPCIRLTEECYAMRKSMDEPWASTEFVAKIKESDNE
jgi:predicted dehydrogenase